MKAIMLAEAEQGLEQAFDYYQSQRRGLGVEMLEEFRRAVDQILEYPNPWQPMDDNIVDPACIGFHIGLFTE